VSRLVEQWFGAAFAQLHPKLQALHRKGGELEGAVDISFATGATGVLGRRLAKGLGVPVTPGSHRLRVHIHSDAQLLHWDRCFDDDQWFRSNFRPVGHYPDGEWVESIGKIEQHLGVVIEHGAWRWQARGLRAFNLDVPAWMQPQVSAGKEIAGDRYRFSVSVALPALGTVLQYRGDLSLRP